jgi:hypothetical protein
MRKLLSSVVYIYADPFDALVCCSWCVCVLRRVLFLNQVQEQTRSKTHSKEEHKSASKEPVYIYRIYTTEESNFFIKKILTPDDGHIGRNM